ncbi:MAG: hypothetical protein IT347_01555 [Candidatus Eisenbacteria bacterium]|nr:hypothetical protein [Candidatus Eisenbacteria bacterium]
MNRFTKSVRSTRHCALAILLGSPLVALGCASPTAPPAPPSGGKTFNGSYSDFVAQVEPVIQRRGCDTGGDCHGGGPRGAFELSPSGSKNTRFDFDQVSLQVNPVTPDSSRILTKPLALAAGGVPHSFKPFASTADTDFVAIRTWVLAGVTP